jgi:hypothetical protein
VVIAVDVGADLLAGLVERLELVAPDAALLELGEEDVPFVVELRDGGPVSELSQAGEAATSDAAVVMAG